MSMVRERIIRELAGEIADVQPNEAPSEALELARAAVCLVCNRPRSWKRLTDTLCRLALDPPELGGFPRGT